MLCGSVMLSSDKRSREECGDKRHHEECDNKRPREEVDLTITTTQADDEILQKLRCIVAATNEEHEKWVKEACPDLEAPDQQGENDLVNALEAAALEAFERVGMSVEGVHYGSGEEATVTLWTGDDQLCPLEGSLWWNKVLIPWDQKARHVLKLWEQDSALSELMEHQMDCQLNRLSQLIVHIWKSKHTALQMCILDGIAHFRL